MQKVVFVKQDTQHLNPTRAKIKNSFIKKSKFGQQKTSSHIIASNITTLQSDSEQKKVTTTSEERSNFNYRQSREIASFQHTTEEIRQEKIATSIRSTSEQYSFLMGRNKELQELLQRKNKKIQTLDRQCQKLQMRLLATSKNDSPNSSFSLSNGIARILLTVSTVEDKRSRIEKLKSIQNRLKDIDFRRAFGSVSLSQDGRKP